MTTQEVAQWIQSGTNLAVLGVGIKLVRHLSRMELKVDTMWDWCMGFIKELPIPNRPKRR